MKTYIDWEGGELHEQLHYEWTKLEQKYEETYKALMHTMAEARQLRQERDKLIAILQEIDVVIRGSDDARDAATEVANIVGAELVKLEARE